MADWTAAERLAAARIFAQALPTVININNNNTEWNNVKECTDWQKKDENDNINDNDIDDDEDDYSPTAEVGETIKG